VLEERLGVFAMRRERGVSARVVRAGGEQGVVREKECVAVCWLMKSSSRGYARLRMTACNYAGIG
jgi:hypothetical protein